MNPPLQLNIEVADKATPAIRALLAQMQDMSEIYEAASGEVYELVRGHLENAAGSRHTTAQRLGAQPTGHLTRAAESVGHSHDANSATIEVTSPGIRRAYGPLDIRPVNKRYLTIPADAASYGKWVSDMRRDGWNVFRPRGRMFLAGTQGKGKEAKNTFRVLFWLAEQVTIPHDPGLMPSDDDMSGAVTRAIKNQIKRKIPT